MSYTETDVMLICDLIQDLCDAAEDENVECLKSAQRVIWNWYAIMHHPDRINPP